MVQRLVSPSFNVEQSLALQPERSPPKRVSLNTFAHTHASAGVMSGSRAHPRWGGSRGVLAAFFSAKAVYSGVKSSRETCCSVHLTTFCSVLPVYRNRRTRISFLAKLRGAYSCFGKLRGMLITTIFEKQNLQENRFKPFRTYCGRG